MADFDQSVPNNPWGHSPTVPTVTPVTPPYPPTQTPVSPTNPNVTTQPPVPPAKPNMTQELPPAEAEPASTDQILEDPAPEDAYSEDPTWATTYDRPIPEEVLYEWEALSRPYQKRSRQYYTTSAAIAGLVCIILLFAGQFLTIGVVLSLAFLAYVVNAVPPTTITNTITNYGIKTDSQMFFWDELGRFWFETQAQMRIMHVEASRFPGRVTVVVNAEDEPMLTELISQVLLNQQPEPTALDKAADWLQAKFPLDG